VLPIRVLGKCGGFTSDIIAAMRWAAGLSVPGAPANPNPAQVLNLSLGGDGACSAAYQSAIDEIVNGQRRLVIVSAGNDGSTVDAPANCRGVAAIGALRHVGNKVGFSNLGPGVAISAPGGNCVNVGAGQPCLFSIETTTNLGQTSPGASGYTDQLNFNVGTSFSAPIVAGIAGLVYAVQPTLTPAQAIARLRAAARPFPVVNEIDPVANQPIQQCRVPAGESDTQTVQCNCTKRTCGAGMADAAATLQQTSQPIAAITVSGTTGAGLTVTLDGTASSAGRNAPLASYAWTAVGGGTLGSTTGPSSSIALPATGAVSARLVVTDTAGGSHVAVVPLTAVVPNVVGQPRAAAATALDAAELAVGTITTQTSATVPLGAVVSQAPAAGGTVGAGTTVSLVLSSGAGVQPIPVPSVVGQTQAAATNTLTNAGLAVGTVTNESSTTVPSGSVISQTPAAGASVAPGSTVALVVSTGPAPAPPPPLPGGGGGGGGGSLDATTLAALLALGMLAGLGRRRRAAR
jgi:serine protease